MDKYIKKYFKQGPGGQSSGHFHRVIDLHHAPDIDQRKIWKLCPELPKGWHEVAQLSTRDRLDFIHAYWLSQLPFSPEFKEAVSLFFNRVDEILVYLVQPYYESPFHAKMIYSLKKNKGFYWGCVPVSQEEITNLEHLYAPQTLPKDYKAFLQVHKSFGKLMDSGILPPKNIEEAYQKVQSIALGHEMPLVDSEKRLVDPIKLIPFYESFSFPSYQCFWADWYPSDEMGNIFFSGMENTISKIDNPSSWAENLAFSTFLEWLAFYLEVIDE